MPDPDDLAPAAAWRAATHHRFLIEVRDGTLRPAAFDAWLAQDALFVADLLAFQARLLARAPRPARAVLATGCVALVEELAWFDGLTASRGLDLPAPRRPATRRYAALLDRLDAGPVPAALTALWVLERVYLLAWQVAAPGAEPYRACVQHWTDPGFARYVDGLGAAVDALGADPAAVPEVLAAEVAFWDGARA